MSRYDIRRTEAVLCTKASAAAKKIRKHGIRFAVFECRWNGEEEKLHELKKAAPSQLASDDVARAPSHKQERG